MTAILALALSSALLAAPPPEPRTPLVSQAVRIAEARTPLFAGRSAARASVTPPGGDSLKNGAIIGGVIGGGAMLLWASRICRETSCAPDALMWSGLAGGLGALIGAGIDALF